METISKASSAQGLQSDTQVEHPPARRPDSKPTNSSDELPSPERRKRTQSSSPPQHLFTVGFYTALIIAVLCLVMGALYLYTFMQSANAGIEQLLDSATSQTLRLAHKTETVNSSKQSDAEPNRELVNSPAKTNSSPERPDAITTPQGGAATALDNSADLRVLPAGYLEALINGRLVMARLALLSCGVSVAFAFGFLGFALFLLGIKGSIDMELQAEHYKASFARLSPGLLLLLASIILIGICVTHPTPFDYATTETVESGVSPAAPARTLPQDSGSGDATKEQLPPRVE